MLASMFLAITLCTGAETQASEALERFREALHSKPPAERTVALEAAVNSRLDWLACMEKGLRHEYDALRSRGAAASTLTPITHALREVESELDLHRRTVRIVRILWMNRFRAEEHMHSPDTDGTEGKR